jgi:hypothetical protein
MGNNVSEKESEKKVTIYLYNNEYFTILARRTMKYA